MMFPTHIANPEKNQDLNPSPLICNLCGPAKGSHGNNNNKKRAIH